MSAGIPFERDASEAEARGTELLLALCAPERGLASRTSIPDAARACRGGASGGDSLRALAERHKVSGLLARALSRRAGSNADLDALFPEPVLERLRKAAAADRAFRALLLEEWRRMESLLRGAGIAALVVKGPSLSLELHGDPLEREYRDIDLLLRERDIEASAALLRSMGYEEMETGDVKSLPARRQAWLRSSSHHRAFKKRNRPFHFELHGLGDDSIGLAPVPTDEAFARMLRLESGGIAFPSLCREDHALAAFLHAARHQWCTLQWLFDSALILAGGSMRVPAEARPSWRGPDAAICAQAFSLLAQRLFAGDWSSTSLSLPAREAGRSRALAASAGKRLAAAGSVPGEGAYLRAFRAGLHEERLSKAKRPLLRALARVLRPGPLDLGILPGLDLPLAFFYLARPFLLAARVARAGMAGRR